MVRAEPPPGSRQSYLYPWRLATIMPEEVLTEVVDPAEQFRDEPAICSKC